VSVKSVSIRIVVKEKSVNVLYSMRLCESWSLSPWDVLGVEGVDYAAFSGGCKTVSVRQQTAEEVSSGEGVVSWVELCQRAARLWLHIVLGMVEGLADRVRIYFAAGRRRACWRIQTRHYTHALFWRRPPTWTTSWCCVNLALTSGWSCCLFRRGSILK